MNEQAVFRALAEAEGSGIPVALATVIRVTGSIPRHPGSKMVIYPEGRIVGTVGGGAMEARVIADGQAVIDSGTARIVSYTLNNLQDGDPGVCGGTVEIFIEAVGVRPTLVVIGCGHVGKALAELGKWANFRVIACDDRSQFCNPDYLPNMDDYLVCPPGEVGARLRITPLTYIAAVTRGVPVDEALFPPLLAANPPYIGLIGSRRRWLLTVKALEEKGISREALRRVHAPIGLELNAETPQEIALSILAEIIMIRRGGTGQPMQWMGE